MKKKTKNEYLSSASFPTMLHLELTGKCNLKCKQCYNDSGNRETLMTADLWKSFASQVADNLFSVTLSGGEPLLLGKDLFELMDIFTANNTWINIISNGFFINKEIAQKLAGYPLGWVEISIDSPYEEYHDYLRGVQGSWHRAVMAATHLSSYNVPVFIGTCVTPKTLAHLDEMVTLASNIGVRGLTLTKILISGRAYRNTDELVLSDEETVEFVAKASELKKKTKEIIINCTTQSVQDALNDHTGTANYQIPIIRPDGKMRLSCFEPVIIGDVRSENHLTLWKRYKQVRDMVTKFPEKLQNIGRNYVDKEVSYEALL